jgi:hypothetical protein
MGALAVPVGVARTLARAAVGRDPVPAHGRPVRVRVGG